jgi:alkylhydroperoxidase/carboxymuconolactone decarboxylase family protein YurZ
MSNTDKLQELASGNLSVIDTLLRMHDGTLEASGLDPATYQLVRMAALAAMDGPPLSWLTHLALSDTAGVKPEQLVGTLIAIAPVIGTPRVVGAAGGILRALGIAVAIEEEEAKEAAAARPKEAAAARR